MSPELSLVWLLVDLIWSATVRCAAGDCYAQAPDLRTGLGDLGEYRDGRGGWGGSKDSMQEKSEKRYALIEVCPKGL